MNDAMQAFLNAEENHGFGLGDVLPRGTYPVEVSSVKADLTKTGSVSTRITLTVLAGPLEGRKAFVDHFLVDLFDPSKTGSTYYNMSATFIRSIGATLLPVNPAQFPSTAEASKAAYNPEAWVGLKFMAEIGIETAEAQAKAAVKDGRTPSGTERDRNRLAGWHSLASPDKGIDAWTAKELPKQVAAKARAAGSASANVPSAATL